MSRGMKITLGVAAVLIIVLAISQAGAQQPPEDGKVAIYRQLLTRAQDETAAMGSQLQAAQIENTQLKSERDKIKAQSVKQEEDIKAGTALVAKADAEIERLKAQLEKLKAEAEKPK